MMTGLHFGQGIRVYQANFFNNTVGGLASTVREDLKNTMNRLQKDPSFSGATIEDTTIVPQQDRVLQAALVQVMDRVRKGENNYKIFDTTERESVVQRLNETLQKMKQNTVDIAL
jgi:hypothetical protein